MKITKLFFFTLLMGLTVILFSCRKEEPEPSGNRDLTPCDTCDTVTPCSFDSTLFNKWWIWENSTGFGFYFSSDVDAWGHNILFHSTDGSHSFANPAESTYYIMSCDSISIGIMSFGDYHIQELTDSSCTLQCSNCITQTSYIYLWPCPDPVNDPCN